MSMSLHQAEEVLMGGDRMRDLSILIFFVLASLSLSRDVYAQEQVWPNINAPGPRFNSGSKDAAVVVAIDEYSYVTHVPGAVDNGLAWVRFLSEDVGVPTRRIKPLFNNRATRESIEDEVAAMAAAVEPGGRLWFIFIGHGAASTDGTDGLLVGMDAQQSARSLYARSVSREALIQTMQKGKAAHVLMVLDTCFSGRNADGSAVVAGLQPLIPMRALHPPAQVSVLSAGKSDQLAGQLPGSARPAFSYLMLGALRGWADKDSDGAVSEREATDYTNEVLGLLLAGDRDQTPQLSSSSPERVLVGERGKHQRLEVAPPLQPVLRALVIPAKMPARVPDAPCELGRVRSADTAENCCYPGQVWASERCVGLLAPEACPAGYALTPDRQSCQELRCEQGKLHLGLGHCCWAGQGWSNAASRCVGVPQCPSSLSAQDEDCVKPASRSSMVGYALVPPGTFILGASGGDSDELPLSSVTLTNGLWVKTTEVTQAEWREVMGTSPSDCKYGCGGSYPVNNISWEESLLFLNKLSMREGLEPCYEKVGGRWSWTRGVRCEGYRMPTEAEWEHAASDAPSMLAQDKLAWFKDNSAGKAHPVATKAPNLYGLYDMLGNVWEWTWDVYGPYSLAPRVDPIAGGLIQSSDVRRVIRSGSWAHDERSCRASNRDRRTPASKSYILGLRPVRTQVAR
jgi:formylglycine-generating enzyme required for sulfatase activity